MYLTFRDDPDGVVALDPATLAERWRATVGSATDLAVDAGRPRTCTSPRRRATGSSGSSTPRPAPDGVEHAADRRERHRALAGRRDGVRRPRRRAPAGRPAGAVAFATRDGALLGWAPGTRNRHSVDALAVSPDGERGLPRQRVGAQHPRRGRRPRCSTRPGARRRGPSRASTTTRRSATSSWTRRAPRTSRATRRSRASATTRSGRSPPTARVALAPRRRTAARRLALSPDEQTVYLTGSFTQIGGVPRAGVAALRASDGAVLPWALSVTGGSAYSQALLARRADALPGRHVHGGQRRPAARAGRGRSSPPAPCCRSTRRSTGACRTSSSRRTAACCT